MFDSQMNIKDGFRSVLLPLLSFPLQQYTARRPQVFNQLRVPPPPPPPISSNHGTNKNKNADASSKEEENQSSRPRPRPSPPTTQRHQPLPDFRAVRSPPTPATPPLLHSQPHLPDTDAGREGKISEDDGGGEGMETDFEEEETGGGGSDEEFEYCVIYHRLKIYFMFLNQNSGLIDSFKTDMAQ
ncbi:hypothetical protein N431DRAFT_455468 [Stipitochalara longipes BDJ]|nr:hypothetical protein N431DRAFT_455468 [Stipitochalara longipes BDJ]